MKAIIALAALLTASVSQADIIRCEFTEPAVTSIYDTATSTLVYESYVNEFNHAYTNVGFVVRGPGKFELVSQEGSVIQSLNLNFAGSDGMSDTVFPYEVQDFGGATSMTLWGGCVSNALPAK